MILLAVQGGNWQRGGGQGDKPTLITAPVEGEIKAEPETEGVPLSEIRGEMERRRAQLAAERAALEGA
ncbi:hypothetical protein [Rhodococcus sp. 06-156-3C]|uniref:hypothetical protein n=1 Tax=Rhodococcus sp. 06-156-3C TaxID=2022486 RepID=UPI000B9BB8B1|nr:hypothetical protein [Rhodococcus sp. 06-156-3C]